MPAGRLRGNTDPSICELQRNLGSNVGIDEHTSTITDETLELETVVFLFFLVNTCFVRLFSSPSHFFQDLDLSLLHPSTGHLFLYFQGTLENITTEEFK